MDKQHPAYDCDPDDLGSLLHDLFKDEVVEEVVVRHPVDGDKTVTRAQYMDMIKAASHVVKNRKLSPSGKLLERQRLERVKVQQQIRFRTAMLTADIRKINLDDETKFGYDVDGHKVDIKGLTFVPVTDYLPGIDLVPGEVGAFVDEQGIRRPIRLVGA